MDHILNCSGPIRDRFVSVSVYVSVYDFAFLCVYSSVGLFCVVCSAIQLFLRMAVCKVQSSVLFRIVQVIVRVLRFFHACMIFRTYFSITRAYAGISVCVCDHSVNYLHAFIYAAAVISRVSIYVLIRVSLCGCGPVHLYAFLILTSCVSVSLLSHLG